MEKAILCWSGGKDSALALHKTALDRRLDVVALLTTITADYSRVSMHGIRQSLLVEQARALNLPSASIYLQKSATNEDYDIQMTRTLLKFKKLGVTACIFGDIFLEDVRRYREERLASAGMEAVFPLWGQDTAGLALFFIAEGFRAVTTCVDGSKLDESFAGREYDERFLAGLPAGVDPCGENGEFHTFAFAGPIFKHEVHFNIGERVKRDSFYFCDLLPIQTEEVHSHN